MKKKKILMIHHSGLIGGASVSFYNIWKVLEEKYEVVGYITDDPPEFLNFLKDKGLNPKVFPFRLGKLTYYSGGNNLFKPRFWYHALHSIFQINYWNRIIRKEKPDLVIVNSKVLCWMGKLFKKNNVKSVCFVRETILGNPKSNMNRFMKDMLEDFSLVSFISNYDLQESGLKKARKVVSKNVLEINNYKDELGKVAACEKFNISSNYFNVLFVGGINELKGIDIALRAMKHLKNEDIKLIIAGKDLGDIQYQSYKSLPNIVKHRKSILFSKSIKQYIIQNGLEKKVEFIGVQPNISKAFGASDILILPMKQPHQARPVFEIGVQKKPVIIADYPHISEFVQNGVNGLTFQPNNSRELAWKILKLKNNKQYLEELGLSNYQCTIKNHTKEYAMTALLKEINDLL
ncbi:hypothetical protein CWR48_03370 [Oceanobacillus arenosus]|uniref:Glycosyl transferase family 1 domain-containing protein n=1 Tax=Oceanobacillus arenosus TaxID=1229153 RepID=A0A3D8Q089_9BACI|nr:glycosyltransferase family 4 protein [Oceanobacillus arenosus]RDW21452.1 hypothetical protein CWR48_03370 [Oceanobacillus arenosus]